MLEMDNFDKIIVANWKLNGSLSFSEEYFNNIKFDKFSNNSKSVIICPPIPYISKINGEKFYKGAQDCSIYSEGAYTGETSSDILKDIGCNFVIVGHSERRILFYESNEIIKEKINNILKSKMIPIFCIGENLEQKKQNLTNEILKEQIHKSLKKDINLNNIIIAYEPIWAIGTGLVPEVEEISKTHYYIKKEILGNINTKILYGGSVKANNYKKILNANNVDGLLVGGSSLNLDEFNQILNF